MLPAVVVGIGVLWWILDRRKDDTSNDDGNSGDDEDTPTNGDDDTVTPPAADEYNPNLICAASYYGNFPFNIGRYLVKYSEPTGSLEARGAATLQDAISDATSGVRSSVTTYFIESIWKSDEAYLDSLDHSIEPPIADGDTIEVYEMNDDNTEAVEVGRGGGGRSSRSTMTEVPDTVEVLEVDSSLKVADKRVLEFDNAGRAGSTDLGSNSKWS